MIQVFGSTSPNVQKIEIMLEETGLDYHVQVVNVHQGEQYSATFTELNPNQKVPVIIDSDGPNGLPLTIFESGAILIYLAEKTGQFLPSEPVSRATTMQWLMIQMTGIGPICGQFNHFSRYAADSTYALARFTSEARRLYDLLEQRLSRVRYLAGDDYSIADMATFPWIRMESKLFGDVHDVMNSEWSGHPHLTRWFHEIAARPPVKNALIAIDQRKSQSKNASAKELDRYFGRGEFYRSLDASPANE